MNAFVEVIDEGQSDKYGAEEAAERRVGDAVQAKRLVRKNAALEAGEYASGINQSEAIADRAREEDAFVAKIEVPFWFRDKDDEVAETFNGQDRITALVEDYSEKAWRIVASERHDVGGGMVLGWEWTFLPKSVATVVRVGGWSSPRESREFYDELGDAMRRKREERKQEMEDADGWEERMDALDA